MGVKLHTMHIFIYNQAITISKLIKLYTNIIKNHLFDSLTRVKCRVSEANSKNHEKQGIYQKMPQLEFIILFELNDSRSFLYAY